MHTNPHTHTRGHTVLNPLLSRILPDTIDQAGNYFAHKELLSVPLRELEVLEVPTLMLSSEAVQHNLTRKALSPFVPIIADVTSFACPTVYVPCC